MASLFTLCYDDITKLKEVCICCTSQNGPLVNIMTCSHIRFLEYLTKIKLDPIKMHVCKQCHHILKKIELFRRQVEDSVALLMEQGEILKISKLHDLQYGPIEIHDSTEPESLEVEIKEESTEIYTTISNSHTELKTEVKIEPETSSDFENDLPLAAVRKVKTRKTRRSEIEKYKGKITTVRLSKKEFEGEREKLRKSDGYLKLPYKCETCIIGFDHEKTLRRHMDSRHKKTSSPLKCEVCLSVLGSKMSFNEHKRRHFRRYECMKCGRWFNHLRSAIQHYDETHAPPGDTIQSDHTCRECGFQTKSNRVYRHHMDKHKPKPECKLCGNCFVNVHGLRVHMYNVHKQSQRRYNCESCDKTFNAKSGLFTHVRIVHTDTAKSFCQLCKTQYRSEHALRYHMKTHSNHITENDKKFMCDECGARFILKHSLRIHIDWAHMKTSAHRCEKCSKLFKSGGQLKKHVSFVHDKKRPPKNKICDYCGRGFSTQTILQSHIRTHTGEKPLQCSQCPARFAHSGALYTHNKLLHTDRHKI